MLFSTPAALVLGAGGGAPRRGARLPVELWVSFSLVGGGGLSCGAVLTLLGAVLGGGGGGAFFLVVPAAGGGLTAGGEL